MTVESVQEYLNAVSSFYGENVWTSHTFIMFLDENPEKSSITKIKLRRMSEQVSFHDVMMVV